MINEFKGKYRWLSNFEEAPFTYKGILWKTSEHAYQAMKCSHTPEFLNILNAETPRQARKLGQSVKMSSLFDSYKLYYMYSINFCKFEQNPHLREKLLETGDQELIEGNDWGDNFWGDCTGYGDNHLGRILMRIREEFK